MTSAGSVWLLTGLSGAGKRSAAAALEKAGARCIDNLPAPLLPGLFDLAAPDRATVAVIDARQDLAAVPAVDGLRTLFLDARDDVLVRRLSESTAPHPCASAGNGLAAINAEREVLQSLRAAADVIIDTSALTPAELGGRVVETVLSGGGSESGLRCVVSSFGYKHGPQTEADWVIDTRFLHNPFWVTELRPLTGLDAAVRDYLLRQDDAQRFITGLGDLLVWVAERAGEHGRHHLHIACGCTGGRHRSVVVAEALAARLREAGCDVAVRHRDVEKPDPR